MEPQRSNKHLSESHRSALVSPVTESSLGTPGTQTTRSLHLGYRGRRCVTSSPLPGAPELGRPFASIMLIPKELEP
jgi:hypothetical protein